MSLLLLRRVTGHYFSWIEKVSRALEREPIDWNFNICDRLFHNPDKIGLRCDSIRKKEREDTNTSPAAEQNSDTRK